MSAAEHRHSKRAHRKHSGWHPLCQLFAAIGQTTIWKRIKRHPLGIALVIVLSIEGVNMLVSPHSVGHLFSNALRITWGVDLVIGSAWSLWGIYSQEVAFHRPGMLLLAAGAWFFSLILAVHGAPLSAVADGVIAAGCLIRAVYSDEILRS